MNFENLTSENIDLYIMKAYENERCCNIQEFWDDVNKIKYLKRLLLRYKNKKVLKERLILNHLIIFFNVFPNEAAVRILFFKLDESIIPYLCSFLYFLDRLPEKVNGINGKDINTYNIILDKEILNRLQKL
jgi:hypothetical protein